jgi:hypothetical protein
MTAVNPFVLYLPLILIGFAAALMRAFALRATDPRRRRMLTAGWVLLILVGSPLWIFVAATLP